MPPQLFYFAMLTEMGQMQLYEAVAGVRFPDPYDTALQIVLHKEERMEGYYAERKEFEDKMIRKLRKMKN